MSQLRKDILFKLFLHANREFTIFQREALTKVFGPEAGVESIKQAIVLIDRKIGTLVDAGWKPIKAAGNAVLKPDHYDRFPIEPTYFLVESGGYHWCIENFCKYVTRFPFKNGIEDLGKAQRNLGMYVKYMKGDPAWSR